MLMISVVKTFWSLALGIGLFLGNAQAAETPAASALVAEFSEAEKLLWTGDQLKAITAPSVLEYRFIKSGTFEAGFSDSVIFTIQEVKPDGMKAASVGFFTGERRFPIPPEDNTNMNPVLKIYLQGDVYEMNRLTDPDGKSRERWRYFQRRIKFALAEAAKIEPTQFELDGKSYAGKRVTFTPYSQDPKRDAFDKFANKLYSVIVSEELPGFIYQIQTTVPAKVAGAPPLVDEILQLIAIKPYSPVVVKRPQ
jgi:hypothetical protein